MCFATGGSDSGAFIDRWNGTRWSSIASPGLPNGYLAGVSCPTVRFCFAVGYTFQGAGQGVVERWDGRRWTRQFSKALTNPETSLLSVSCTSTTFCMAAGRIYRYQTDADNVFVARWNGHTWSVSENENSNGYDQDWLNGISCVSPSSCMAVGYDESPVPPVALADHWNGRDWTLKRFPNPKPGQAFYSVSCATTTYCLASGDPKIERWSRPGGWHDITPPSTAKYGISSVWCSSTISCFGGGAWANGPDVAHWNGSQWTLVAKASGGNYLSAITCTGSTCLAVGTVALAHE